MGLALVFWNLCYETLHSYDLVANEQNVLNIDLLASCTGGQGSAEGHVIGVSHGNN